jgi:hypothetical protein
MKASDARQDSSWFVEWVERSESYRLPRRSLTDDMAIILLVIARAP